MKLLHIGLHAEKRPMNGFQKALSNRAWVFEISDSSENINDRIADSFDSFNPEVVFIQVQREGVLDAEVIRYISENSCTINWTGDVRNEVPKWMVELAESAPKLITAFSNTTDVEKMIDMGHKSRYLQIGYDPDIFHPFGASVSLKNIVFLGNHYENMFPLSGYRKEIVLALYNEFGNSFGAWGMNHKISEGTTNFSQEYEAAIYRGAKIGVNVSHFNYGMYSSDRMFRMMGSGVFCLSHYFDGIEDMFTIGKHLDVFHSIDELKERIRYYMDNPMLRNSIAENGANHVLMNYTYDHMVNNIIELSK